MKSAKRQSKDNNKETIRGSVGSQDLWNAGGVAHACIGEDTDASQSEPGEALRSQRTLRSTRAARGDFYGFHEPAEQGIRGEGPVKGYQYDMSGHVEQCVEVYCTLAKVSKSTQKSTHLYEGVCFLLSLSAFPFASNLRIPR